MFDTCIKNTHVSFETNAIAAVVIFESALSQRLRFAARVRHASRFRTIVLGQGRLVEVDVHVPVVGVVDTAAMQLQAMRIARIVRRFF